MQPSFITQPLPRMFSRTCRNLSFQSSRTRTASRFCMTTSSPLPSPLQRKHTILCVGDIHGQWDEIDESAIRGISPDLVLFVGDYGDENVSVTRQIANFASSVPFSVATVFGNHDAFFTQSTGGIRRSPYSKSDECRVTSQMQIMADLDVSYRSVAMEKLGLSINGGRSFSVGGPNWKYTDFYRKFIGVYGLEHSTEKLKQAVKSAKHDVLVFLSHSGPKGLGALPKDPCGKDWGNQPGGDYGDEDLRAAIELARESRIRVPLVVFGHMHRTLLNSQGDRVMLKTEDDGDGNVTVMLNAAVFPRHEEDRRGVKLRHFQVVELGSNGYVECVRETWASRKGEIVRSINLYLADASEAVDESVVEATTSLAAMTVT